MYEDVSKRGAQLGRTRAPVYYRNLQHLCEVGEEFSVSASVRWPRVGFWYVNSFLAHPSTKKAHVFLSSLILTDSHPLNGTGLQEFERRQLAPFMFLYCASFFWPRSVLSFSALIMVFRNGSPFDRPSRRRSTCETSARQIPYAFVGLPQVRCCTRIFSEMAKIQ